jgi:hypothetical protein
MLAATKLLPIGSETQIYQQFYSHQRITGTLLLLLLEQATVGAGILLLGTPMLLLFGSSVASNQALTRGSQVSRCLQQASCTRRHCQQLGALDCTLQQKKRGYRVCSSGYAATDTS